MSSDKRVYELIIVLSEMSLANKKASQQQQYNLLKNNKRMPIISIVAG